MMIRWFWIGDDMDIFSLFSHHIRFNDYWMVNILKSFFFRVFCLFCHVWLTDHTVFPYRLNTAWSAFLISLSVCYTFLPIFSNESFLIQSQSILLPLEWPCIFFRRAYHMFTFFSIVGCWFSVLIHCRFLLTLITTTYPTKTLCAILFSIVQLFISVLPMQFNRLQIITMFD